MSAWSRYSSSASSFTAPAARSSSTSQLVPLKSYRVATSLRAWFTALSTSWRSTEVEMSKDWVLAMNRGTVRDGVGSGRGREHGQHHEALLAGVPDAVRHAVRRHEHRPLRHRLLAALEQEQAAAAEHVVHLVHALVGVQAVLLSGLEAVEPDEHALGAEERGLPHALGVEHGVLLGTEGL